MLTIPEHRGPISASVLTMLTGGRFIALDRSHRIFDSFFAIDNLDAIVHPMSGIRPVYLGLFEDNDPNRRLLAVANFDNDVPSSRRCLA